MPSYNVLERDSNGAKQQAREPTPLAEEMGGLPDNMAEILRTEEVFKVQREDGRACRGGNPERLITRPADKAAAR